VCLGEPRVPQAGDLQDASYVDQFLENDSVLYMVFKKEGSDAWEDIDVEQPAKS